jgi:hypothetical protein
MTTKIKLLALILKDVAEQNIEKLNELKQNHHDIKRPDFIWHYLLQSFATMGNSKGWDGLIGEKKNYNRIVFDELETLSADERTKIVNEVCRIAKIRMPAKKAEFIIRCFDQINGLGGQEFAKEKLLSLEGRDKKINFLLQFHGIGEKYARNIMMDVYHEDFRNSIAIDDRIKKISKLIGIEYESYQEHEKFYLEAGKKAGLNGWEVDRLLYNFTSIFESRLTSQRNQY